MGDFVACEAFPNLNGGCYMGRAGALADALEWMHKHRDVIGRDDQENKWHYYNNHFPERVVLDHRQRIFTCFFGCARDRFHVTDRCQVVDSYTNEQVCFAHANGGTKWEMLAPLLRELERRGCREPSLPRKVNDYAGMGGSRFIWVE